MTLETKVIVRCDGRSGGLRRCRDYLDDEAYTEEEARLEAREYGWTVIDGDDLCTSCSAWVQDIDNASEGSQS